MPRLIHPENRDMDDDLRRLRVRHLQRQQEAGQRATSAAGRLSETMVVLRRVMGTVIALVVLYGTVLGSFLVGKWLWVEFWEWWARI